MKNPADVAERARVDRRIAEWNAKQITVYDEHVKARDGKDETGAGQERDSDFPEYLTTFLADYDFGEHIRCRFPVGFFLDSINEEGEGDHRSVSQLIQVAETGVLLLYAAIGHVNATEEFLEEARSRWGPLVDAALQEMNIQ